MIRGDIYYTYLEGIGNEQNGIRPVLIIQNDIGNKFSNTTIVAALTTKKQNNFQPTHVFIPTECGIKAASVVMLEQLQTIDKSRIKEYICTLDNIKMQEIDKALKISIGLKGKPTYDSREKSSECNN